MNRFKVVLLAVFLIFITSSVYALTISGLGDIGTGVRDVDGGTVAGTGEYGNFAYLEFTSDESITMDKALFHFTGTDAIMDGPTGLIPPVTTAGVDSASAIGVAPTQEFGWNFTGFDSGDSILFGIPLNKMSIGTGVPLAPDYLPGTLEVFFSDGTTLSAPWAPSEAPLGILNARAVFSFTDNGNTNGGVVPEPATMLLFGFGLLGLAGVNRRKK